MFVSRNVLCDPATLRGGADRSGRHGGVFVGIIDEWSCFYDRYICQSKRVLGRITIEVCCFWLGRWKAVNGRQYIVYDSVWMVCVSFFP